MDYESGVSRYMLLYREQINGKVLLYSTGYYTQYPVINHMEKNMKKNIYIYIHIYIYTYIYICITEPFCYIAEINTRLLEKVMAPYSSTLACKIPWTEEPGRLQLMRL